MANALAYYTVILNTVVKMLTIDNVIIHIILIIHLACNTMILITVVKMLIIHADEL